MALGRPAWREAREYIQSLISSSTLPKDALIPMDQAILHLPCEIGDYTDFYASKEHATNVGTMFRGKDNALMPNWTRIPVGYGQGFNFVRYHGRASSVVVSGTDLVRPSGQILDMETKLPYFSPSKKV
jgi:fumarylacetoacetase